MSKEVSKRVDYIDPGSPERLKRMIQFLPGFKDYPIKFFFALALEPYYDRWTSPSGMQSITGHIIFRLSDTIDEDERRAMHVYPDKGGSLMVDLEYGEGHMVPFASLEDWREQWMNHYPEGIPLLEQLWPDAPKFLPPVSQ